MTDQPLPPAGDGGRARPSVPDTEPILSLIPAGEDGETSELREGFCVCYSRFSTKGQKETSITRQYEYHVSCAERHGLKMLPGQHHFIDRARTGARTNNRPSLKAMLELARTGAFKYLFVESIHRLSRRVVTVVTIYEELKDLGIEIIVSGPSSGVVNDITAVFHGLHAQQQRRSILAHTSAGKKQAAARGGNMACVPYGYAKGAASGQLVVFEPHALVVRRIFGLLYRGLSPQQVARLLNVDGVKAPDGGCWSAAAIYNGIIGGIANNTKYCGVNLYNRTQSKTAGDGSKRIVRARKFWKSARVLEWVIVDPSIWISVYRRLSSATASRSRKTPRERSGRRSISIFGGRYFCACGARMNNKSQKSTGLSRIICSSGSADEACGRSRSTSLVWLEYELLSEIEERIVCPEAVDLFRAEYGAELERAQAREAAEASTLRTRIDRLTMWLSRSLLDGVTRGVAKEDVVKQRQAWTAERDMCRSKFEESASKRWPALPEVEAMADLRTQIGRLKAALPFKDETEADMLLVVSLRSLISRIVVRRLPGEEGYTLEITSSLAEGVFGEITVERRCRPTSSAGPRHVAAVEGAQEIARTGRYALLDEDWKAVEPLLSNPRRIDRRAAIDAALLSLRTGVNVAALPSPYGGSSLGHVVRRLARKGSLQTAVDALIAASSPAVTGLDPDALKDIAATLRIRR
ncbi:recombinase family protein [Methylobacterium fujisawaense]|uniref:recombinase family protein n=1 Tax=Methylobacterium fujisawaense TaxID=107400 RepID=UPI00313A780E